MFESDDFDQVLSQYDFPGLSPKAQTEKTKNEDDKQAIPFDVNINSCKKPQTNITSCHVNTPNKDVRDKQKVSFSKECSGYDKGTNSIVSPKHSKRKLINSHFDHQSKRKFPGPAGLLTGTLEQSKDETICHMELLSQDIEFSQNHLRRDLFESSLWKRLLQDVKSWNLHDADPIRAIKQQALAGNLQRRKAQTVTAFVESVDRSVTDPLITLRDSTGNIKCTLHRDAWSTFSPYIVSEYCALVLWKPTVLTTGSAFKKHYLNITLSNIFAIYSSAILADDEKPLPDGYARVSEDDITIIKTALSPQNMGSDQMPNNGSMHETHDLLDGLDSIFSDELF